MSIWSKSAVITWSWRVIFAYKSWIVSTNEVLSAVFSDWSYLVIAVELLIAVKVPAAAEWAPIVVPSIAPPSILTEVETIFAVTVPNVTSSVVPTACPIEIVLDEPLVATVTPVPPLTVILPAPENSVNSKLLVPIISLPLLFVQTKPLSAFVVPSSTNTNAPFAEEPVSKSSVRVGVPLVTIYIPFSPLVVWSLIKILSSVANVTPSTVSPLAKAELNVPLAVVATLTEDLICNPSATLST